MVEDYKLWQNLHKKDYKLKSDFQNTLVSFLYLKMGKTISNDLPLFFTLK